MSVSITSNPPVIALRRLSRGTMTRVRPDAFNRHVATTQISVLSRKQSRTIFTCIKRRQISRRNTSIPSIRSVARARSFWTFKNNTLFNSRLSSSFHSPECKWVRSTGDPRHTPRDKDCPACQEEEKQPHEFTTRELIWQRQLQFWKEFLHKDPYDALFGRSNDMLRGRPWTPRFLWDQEIKPWGLRGWEASTSTKLKGGKDETIAGKTAKVDETPKSSVAKVEDKPHPSANPPKSDFETIPVKKSTQEAHIEGSGRWTYQSTNGSGESVWQSGNFVYDAVSGRMVPVEKEASTSITSEASIPDLPITDNAETIPVTSSNTANKATTAPQPSLTPQSVDAVLGAKHKRSAQLAAIDRKLALVGKLEEDLSATRDSLKSLVKFHCADMTKTTRPARLFALERALHGLKGTETALQSFKEVQKSLITRANVIRDEGESSGLPVNERLSRTKETFEQSWRMETQSHSRSDVKASKPDAESERPDPHYRQKPIERGDLISDTAYRFLARRDRSFKQMTAHEIGLHRRALLASWEKKHASSDKPESAAERLLKDEIANQKSAMAAFEGKYRSKTETPAAAKVPGNQNSTPYPMGEGDMCPNAVKYLNEDRLYKNKAPHALREELEKEHGRLLVKSIREIYERAYGKIDINHRQGQVARIVEKDEVDSRGSSNASAKVQTINIPSSQEPKIERLVPALDRHIAKQEKAADPQSISTTTDGFPSRVLFYNASTGKVEESVLQASGTHDDRLLPLPLLNALTKLDHPHKFVSHVRLLQKQGYDIVEVKNNTLTLKLLAPKATSLLGKDSIPGLMASLVEIKRDMTPMTDISSSAATTGDVPVADTTSASQSSKVLELSLQSTHKNITNPIDPSLQMPFQTQAEKFASPTGFVNHDVWEPSVSNRERLQDSFSAPKSSQKIRKEEPVFSGPKDKTETSSDRFATDGFYAASRHGSRRDRRRYRRMHGYHKWRSLFKGALLGSLSIIGYLTWRDGKLPWQKESSKKAADAEKGKEYENAGLLTESAQTKDDKPEKTSTVASTVTPPCMDIGLDFSSPSTYTYRPARYSSVTESAKPEMPTASEAAVSATPPSVTKSEPQAIKTTPTPAPQRSTNTPEEEAEPRRHPKFKAKSSPTAKSTSAEARAKREKAILEKSEAERLRLRKERLDVATDIILDASLLSLSIGGLVFVFLRMLER